MGSACCRGSGRNDATITPVSNLTRTHIQAVKIGGDSSDWVLSYDAERGAATVSTRNGNGVPVESLAAVRGMRSYRRKRYWTSDEDYLPSHPRIPDGERVDSPRVLFLGIDGVGKTSLIYYLENRRVAPAPPPTRSTRTKWRRLEIEGGIFVGDTPGLRSLRSLWSEDAFLDRDVDVLVWVVDATDHLRYRVAQEELASLLDTNPYAMRVPMLILANKMDHCELTLEEIAAHLNLKSLDHPLWALMGSSYDSTTVLDGLGWAVSGRLPPNHIPMMVKADVVQEEVTSSHPAEAATAVLGKGVIEW